ncbi:DUF4089 domain-containing protein [Spirulina subsalsa FACHB-351]|uniref:DUF4089 domain-containing protein n=1 Tax=Spirulina subsalsa FACHB-351 TaxID=234711 RepID=A0ABT3L3U7_9CYAN|nr:DUF4089 domain-containing protein [Spirulina subsalsa]MCW6036122.1 DUF4089 domain-containing protein [Spirulina subsalsa FACHB-351]
MSEKDSPINLREYVQQVSSLMNLTIAPEYWPGIIQNLEQMAELAPLVTEFPLPEEIESVPVFEP